MKVRISSDYNYLTFLIVFLLYFIPRYLEYTSFYNILFAKQALDICKSLSYVLSLLLFGLKFINNKKQTAKYTVIISICLLYFSYQAFLENHSALFVILIFSFIFNEKYAKIYFRDIFVISCILYLFTIVACYFGCIENIVSHRNKFGSIWVSESFGFEYPGQMVMMLLPLVFLYFYIKNCRVNALDCFFCLALNIVVYTQCKTIFGSVLICVFLIAFSILKYSISFSRFLKDSQWINKAPFIFVAIDVLLLFLFDGYKSIGKDLDILLNGRLSVSQRVINKYGISFLGSDFKNSASNFFYEIIDSEYIHLIVAEGIIYLVFALLLCSLMLKYAQKNKDKWLVLILLMAFFNSIVNNGIFSLVLNPFVICLVPAIKHYFNKGTLLKRKEIKFNHTLTLLSR